MQNYKELKVWEKAHHFTVRIYECTKMFPKDELYGLTNLLRRATSSIPANLAEGSGKFTQQDFGRYLNIALGSVNEPEYFLILSKEIHYLPEAEFTELIDKTNEIEAMLISLIKKVRKTINV